jgi:hypothetical protein
MPPPSDLKWQELAVCGFTFVDKETEIKMEGMPHDVIDEVSFRPIVSIVVISSRLSSLSMIVFNPANRYRM